MLIYAKSAFVKNNIDIKMDIGCDGIEIQLLGELINGNFGSYFKANDVFDIKGLEQYPVKVIHCPLLWYCGLPDVNIESMLDKNSELFNQVCYIANYYGEVQNSNIIVVVHTEMSVKDMRLIGLLDKVVSLIKDMLNRYNFIEIAIENVIPVKDATGTDVHLCNNFHFDNIELVEYIKEKLNNDRVGTCLDTCHAMISAKYIERIISLMDCTNYSDYSLDSYFKVNKEHIKLIHLSDFKGDGYSKGMHGVKFSSINKEKLKNIVDLYDKYKYNCPVTLEVSESDYLVCDNYRETRETLLSVLKDSR